jgi:hypothetical protein
VVGADTAWAHEIILQSLPVIGVGMRWRGEGKKDELYEGARILCEDERWEEGRADGGGKRTRVGGWHAGERTQVNVECRLRWVFCRQTGFDWP